MSRATHPDINDAALRAAVEEKRAAAVALLRDIARDFSPVAFASSFGVEDMLLTDLIVREQLAIEIFSLDTGRLPAETYELMQRVQQHYGIKLKVYYPRHELIEDYVGQHGINAFYESVELRRRCCHIRKVEPLGRALAGKRAWITGQRAQQAATRTGLALREFDAAHGIEKFNPLAEWRDPEVWAYVRSNDVPYNALHDRHYPSIGCAPCTRAISIGEDIRAGRWWWENADTKECGLHPHSSHVGISSQANGSVANVKAPEAPAEESRSAGKLGTGGTEVPPVTPFPSTRS